MSYRVTLERYGAEVTVDTIAEVRELLEALYPRLEMTVGPALPPELRDEAAPSSLPEVPQGPRRRLSPRPSQAKPRASDEAKERIAAGLVNVLKAGPRKLQELADAAGIGRRTALDYLEELAGAGAVHQTGRGPSTRWALGRGPKEEP